MEDVLSTGVQERAMKRALRETEEGEDGDTTTEGKTLIQMVFARERVCIV